MVTKEGKELPKRGKVLHPADTKDGAAIYCHEVASALGDEFGTSRHAVKLVMGWTGASHRTVKYWFAGRAGPRGEHLVALIRHSDFVLRAILVLAHRTPATVLDGRMRLTELVEEMIAIIRAQPVAQGP